MPKPKPTYEQEDLAFIVETYLNEKIEQGESVLDPKKWQIWCEGNQLERELARPGYITKVANGLRAKRDGKRITQCREVRGTHALSYIYDPEGTDTPPEWWNRDEAKAYEEARNAEIEERRTARSTTRSSAGGTI